MGGILAHEFMSLDGVVENPSWTAEFGLDPKMGETLSNVMSGCRAILLGRTTYEMFAPAWSTRNAADDPGAPFFNDTDKYVVSATMTSAEWKNTSLLGAYDAKVIRALKERVAGDIYVSGSISLVRGLLSDGLLDRLELFVYPVVLGAGLRLFPEGRSKQSLELMQSDTYANGVVHLCYAPRRCGQLSTDAPHCGHW